MGIKRISQHFYTPTLLHICMKMHTGQYKLQKMPQKMYYIVFNTPPGLQIVETTNHQCRGTKTFCDPQQRLVVSCSRNGTGKLAKGYKSTQQMRQDSLQILQNWGIMHIIYIYILQSYITHYYPWASNPNCLCYQTQQQICQKKNLPAFAQLFDDKVIQSSHQGTTFATTWKTYGSEIHLSETWMK